MIVCVTRFTGVDSPIALAYAGFAIKAASLGRDGSSLGRNLRISSNSIPTTSGSP